MCDRYKINDVHHFTKKNIVILFFLSWPKIKVTFFMFLSTTKVIAGKVFSSCHIPIWIRTHDHKDERQVINHWFQGDWKGLSSYVDLSGFK